jgi:hypothetical protein
MDPTTNIGGRGGGGTHMLAKGKQYIRLATNSLLHDDNIECYLLKLVRSISITIYERKTHQGGIHQAKTHQGGIHQAKTCFNFLFFVFL